MMHKAWSNIEGVPYCFSRSSVEFQGHTGQKIADFRTVTWVLINQWLSNDAQSLKQHRRGALLFFKIILQISRSHETKKTWILTQNGRFRTVTPVRIHWWLWNGAQSLKQYRRCALLFFKVISQISRSQGTKNGRFWPELSFSGL